MAASQSLPTAYSSDPVCVGVSGTVGAPVSALAPAEAPTPAAPVKVTMVSDCTKPLTAGVEVTVALVRTLDALARQTSDVPNCVLTRLTRLQVNPAPLTVIVCPPADGPSDATNASSSSGDAEV